jgi:hypothetical protein
MPLLVSLIRVWWIWRKAITFPPTHQRYSGRSHAGENQAEFVVGETSNVLLEFDERACPIREVVKDASGDVFRCEPAWIIELCFQDNQFPLGFSCLLLGFACYYCADEKGDKRETSRDIGGRSLGRSEVHGNPLLYDKSTITNSGRHHATIAAADRPCSACAAMEFGPGDGKTFHQHADFVASHPYYAEAESDQAPTDVPAAQSRRAMNSGRRDIGSPPMSQMGHKR